MLCFVFRLLSLGLRSSDTLTWATALQAEHVLCRILWIAENSLNPQLIEKVPKQKIPSFAVFFTSITRADLGKLLLPVNYSTKYLEFVFVFAEC